MMVISKNNSLIIIITCILVIILISALYFIFFFNRAPIFCSNKGRLAELLRIDFSDVEITDIQYKNSKDGIFDNYTIMAVFLNESEEWENKEYYTDSKEWFDSNPKNMLPAEIAELRAIGIELHNIKMRGVNFNQIKVGFSMAEFGIYWFQVDESHDGESNVVLVASVPRKISMNVDKILKETSRFKDLTADIYSYHSTTLDLN